MSILEMCISITAFLEGFRHVKILGKGPGPALYVEVRPNYLEKTTPHHKYETNEQKITRSYLQSRGK
jgi:hypothetical protein